MLTALAPPVRDYLQHKPSPSINLSATDDLRESLAGNIFLSYHATTKFTFRNHHVVRWYH